MGKSSPPAISPTNDIDLNTTTIPNKGIEVEIEGLGKMDVPAPGNLITAVGQAYTDLTGNVFLPNAWEVKLLEFQYRPAYMWVELRSI